MISYIIAEGVDLPGSVDSRLFIQMEEQLVELDTHGSSYKPASHCNRRAHSRSRECSVTAPGCICICIYITCFIFASGLSGIYLELLSSNVINGGSYDELVVAVFCCTGILLLEVIQIVLEVTSMTFRRW